MSIIFKRKQAETSELNFITLKLFFVFISLLLLAKPGVTEELPLLCNSVSCDAVSVDIDSLQLYKHGVEFRGGATYNDRPVATEINITTTDFVEVLGYVKPPRYTAYTPGKVYVHYQWDRIPYMYGRNSAGELQNSAWSGVVSDLIPLVSSDSLPEPIQGSIFQGQLPRGDYSINYGLSYYNYAYDQFFTRSPEPITIRVNNAAPSPLEGEFVARLAGFLPNPDGFGFENYGDTLDTDLTDQDIIEFLGKEQACYLTPEGACTLTAFAQTWRQQTIEESEGGHCYGMAVASTLLHKGLPFKGNTKGSDFQNGAVTTLELQKSSVRNLIAYYMSTQDLNIFVLGDPANIKKPSEILQLIIDQMHTNDPIAVIAIFDSEGSGGHGITPYAVQDRGNGVFWVYVYDNNYPDDARRYITINRDQELWSYQAQVNPQAEANEYFGNIDSGNMFAIPLSAHEGPFEILDGAVRFQFSGQGTQMLIENWDEKHIGYDFSEGGYVNEIKGAVIAPILEDGAPPRYFIPILENEDDDDDKIDKMLKQMFLVTVGSLAGEDIESNEDSSLFMQSNKAIAEFSGIRLTSGEKFNVAIHPNAQLVYLESESSITQNPIITLMLDNNETQQGRIYELSQLELVAGTNLLVMIDGLDLLVYSVSDDDHITPLDNSYYSLNVSKMDASGQVTARKANIKLPVGKKTRIRVQQWSEDDNGRIAKSSDAGVIEIKTLN